MNNTSNYSEFLKQQSEFKDVTVISSDDYNPQVDNLRYYDNNLSEPVHHDYSHKFLLRYANNLIRFRHNYHKLRSFLSFALPTLFIASIPFVWAFLPGLFALSSGTLLAIQIATSVVSGLGLIMAGASIWAAKNVLGDATHPGESIYKENGEITYSHKTAEAVLTVGEGLPHLTITAQNPEDAGFVEGYIQGEQIEQVYANLDNLYRKIRVFIGAPSDDADLESYLKAIENKIPEHYLQEMRGKVDGYNHWRQQNGRPESGNLNYYKYLLLQLLPDAHHFNPFKTAENPQASEHTGFGCTSIAFKVGEYTCYSRVLDWPGYGIAGKSFIEIERRIGDTKPTTDVSLCLLSGAITSLNSDNVLTQINVSRVQKVNADQGMPGVFAIRYLSENCATVKDMQETLQDTQTGLLAKGPLSGMHISATDGLDTLSYHAYQGYNGGHVIETLGQRPMVVANFGFDPEKKELISHVNSSERLENINHFFAHHPIPTLTEDKQQENLAILRQYLHQLMALDLVDNFESVYSAMYIYHGNQLLDARASTNNAFAGSRALEDFSRLSGAPRA